ncbi:MAG: hypothetical protein A2049_03485 [Elusimicrobia bacterium GWA2_62_23]|nr:MAG: hypothetical protein A2049_03485 [Elusimicrobia bacterium GWA2_62_23]
MEAVFAKCQYFVHQFVEIVAEVEVMEDTFFWTYSAIAQVFGALSGILGIFVVYALEWIQNSIEWSRKDLVASMNGTNIEAFSLDKQIEATENNLSEWAKSGFRKEEAATAKKAIDVIRGQRKKRKHVTAEFKWVFWQMISVVILSLLFLPFSQLLNIKWRIGCLSVVGIFAICSLIRSCVFVSNALKRETIVI